MPGESLTKRHRDYLISRGFDPFELIKLYGLRGTGPLGDYKHRIIIPIIYQGQTVSYQGRDITGRANLPYKACPISEEIFHHKHLVYNFDSATKNAIVVEGILDAWRIGAGAVATFGTGYTTKQAQLLRKFERVFILYDLEDTAQEQADQLSYELSAMGTKSFIISDLLKEGEDPDMLSPDDVKALRRETGLD